MKCTLSSCSLEKSNSFTQQENDSEILTCLKKYVKSQEELDKYANWFYHPKGNYTESTLSVGSDDFSVFSDGSELSTDAFASGESVESVESVTSESAEVGEPIEIEDSLESSTDSSEDFDDSVGKRQIKQCIEK